MPPLRTGLLSFGLVSIPVELQPAIKNQNVSFHWLHAKCGSRIQYRYFCPICNVPVEREDLVRGYEFAKDQYVRFTDAELESLETESSNNIDLKEFVPVSKIDPVYFESSYYLGAAKGGEKPYRLLADALAKTDRAAIAQLVSRGKEQLVLIRPYENGLIMHGLYYANEVRDFGQIPKGENAKLSEQEITLGADLIEQMADKFDPEKYRDEYRIRVLSMLDEKSKGREITVTPAPEPRHGQVIDLMQALKESMERARPKKQAAPGQKKRKKAS
jgi:DNA end-binding protein Ku